MSFLEKFDEESKLKVNHQLFKGQELETWIIIEGDNLFKVKFWIIKNANKNETLKQIWLNEVRQLNKLKAAPNSKKYLELLFKAHYDEQGYYLIYETNDEVKTLSSYLEEITTNCEPKPKILKLRTNKKLHWLSPIKLKEIQHRITLWKNILRISRAIKILHDQGIVHRNISTDAIIYDKSQDIDDSERFKLTGFELSLYLNNLKFLDYSIIDTDKNKVSSLDVDWKDLGKLICDIMGIDVESIDSTNLTTVEKNTIKHMINKKTNSYFNYVNAEEIEKEIKKIIADLPNYKKLIDGMNFFNITCNDNDSNSESGLSKIREKINKYANTDYTYNEIYNFIEEDTNIKNIEIRQCVINGNNVYLMKGKKLIYQIKSYDSSSGFDEWEVAYITNIFENYPKWSDFSERLNYYGAVRFIKKVKIPYLDSLEINSWAQLINQFEKENIYNDKEISCLQGLLLNHAIDVSMMMVNKYKVKYRIIPKNSLIYENNFLDNSKHILVKFISDAHKNNLSKQLKIESQAERFKKYFMEGGEGTNIDWILDKSNEYDEKLTYKLRFIKKIDQGYIFSSVKTIGLDNYTDEEYLLYPSDINGSKISIERRNKAYYNLLEQQNLLESISDPNKCIQEIEYGSNLTKSLNKLDEAKKPVFTNLLKTHPNFVVQGPPGVGKTHLITTLVDQIFQDESGAKIVLSAQSHSTVQVLYDEIKKKCDISDLLLIDAFNIEKDSSIENEKLSKRITKKYIEDFSKSKMCLNALQSGKLYVVSELNEVLVTEKCIQLFFNILKAANLIFTTTNSKTLEDLISDKVNFDFSIMEESAKAAGIELISPMLISHRRVLIGDYYQLPAFLETTINRIVQSGESFNYKLIFSELLKNKFRKDIFNKLNLNYLLNEENEVKDQNSNLKITRSLNKYFSLFKFLAKEAEKLKLRNQKSFGDIINTQYRMHPDISKIVSESVYDKKLLDDYDRAELFRLDISNPINFKSDSFFGKIDSSFGLIWIDIPDKNDKLNITENFEVNYINEKEIKVVQGIIESIEVNSKFIRDVHKEPIEPKVGIQVLSPYKRQVVQINRLIKRKDLNTGFFIENGEAIAKTVDSFQGDEADIIIISMVRHNTYSPHTKALGFLMDMRRMNVLLSRAKYRMIIIGCFKMFKYWSNQLKLMDKINLNDTELNNIDFLNKFVDLLDEDYEAMLSNLNTHQEHQIFKNAQFISSDSYLGI